MQSHHEEHEGSEGKPGSAGRRTGFMDFWVGSAVPADRNYFDRDEQDIQDKKRRIYHEGHEVGTKEYMFNPATAGSSRRTRR